MLTIEQCTLQMSTPEDSFKSLSRDREAVMSEHAWHEKKCVSRQAMLKDMEYQKDGGETHALPCREGSL